MPEPELPWYQFSLRSLLLFTVFVAVLCSIGVCTDWSFVAVTAAGGIAGGIVARRWLGLVIGSLSGAAGAVIGVGAYAFVWSLLFGMPIDWAPSWQSIAAMKIAAITGSLVSGGVGGIAARRRSERRPKTRPRVPSTKC